MIITIDTREQNPYTFSDKVIAERGCLNVGDYSIKGLEERIVIERKSVGDFLGSITQGRERFTKELRQLRAYDFAGLVIEGDWRPLITGQWDVPTAVNPNSVIGSLLSFVTKYRVVPILAGNHFTAGIIVERLLSLYAADIERNYKTLSKTKPERTEDECLTSL